MERQRSVVGLALAFIGAAILHLSPALSQTAPEPPAAEQGVATDTPAPAAEQGVATDTPAPAAGSNAPVNVAAPAPETAAQQAPTAPAVNDTPPAGAAPATEQAAAPSAEAAPPTQPTATPADTAPGSKPAEGQAAQAAPALPADAQPSAQPSDPGQAVAEPGSAAAGDNQAGAQTTPAPAENGKAEMQEPSPAPGEATPAEAAGAAGPGASQPAVVAEPAKEEPPAIDPKDVTLTIATWGGAYGQAQNCAFFRPFSKRYGYQLKTVTYDGDYDALKDQGSTPAWSLVDMNGEAMERACDENRLERLDASVVEASPDGAPVSEDLLPGAVRPCGIASAAWSAVLVYDKRLSTAPESLEDFFDIGKIPGKRLLPKQPRYSLELALMADGVAPDQVYATLRTSEGQDRAFRKLSSIKDDILWWDSPSEVFERIADKDVVMGLGFNGRAFMAIVASQQPIGILWDRQIYTYDYWSIPRGAANQDAARRFIRFATSPGPQADQARLIPYGPSRHSALKLVGKHAELDLEMKPFLPTSEANFGRALAFDGTFWTANEAALNARFADWVEGRQLPVQKQAVISQ